MGRGETARLQASPCAAPLNFGVPPREPRAQASPSSGPAVLGLSFQTQTFLDFYHFLQIRRDSTGMLAPLSLLQFFLIWHEELGN